AAGDLVPTRTANRRALELSPDSRSALIIRCTLDFRATDRAAAREHCGSIVREDVRRFWKTMMAQEWGAPDEARAELAAFSARFGEEDPMAVADLYAWRGDADQAFEWLDRAYQRHSGLS